MFISLRVALPIESCKDCAVFHIPLCVVVGTSDKSKSLVYNRDATGCAGLIPWRVAKNVLCCLSHAAMMCCGSNLKLEQKLSIKMQLGVRELIPRRVVKIVLCCLSHAITGGGASRRLEWGNMSKNTLIVHLN